MLLVVLNYICTTKLLCFGVLQTLLANFSFLPQTGFILSDLGFLSPLGMGRIIFKLTTNFFVIMNHFSKLLSFFTAVLLSLPMLAQVSAGGTPFSFTNSSLGSVVPQVTMPAVNETALLAEDALNNAKDEPYRFGAELNVHLDMNNCGLWEMLPNGDRIWRVTVYSKNAKTLNLVYDHFYMPPGAKLFLYNPAHTEVIGAFTQYNNKPHHRFATGLIRGNTTVLEYYEPAEVFGEGIISINKVVHGYRGFFSAEKGFGDSGSCNNNVNCPEAADWQDQKRAVAMILSGGFRACSGAMVNNVANDCTPYFLTANHCLDSSVETWVFMFNYESPTCENIDGPLNQTVSGCTLLAHASPSDFALLLLSELPPVDYNVYYAGWSAETVAGTSSTGIHHPAGDIKKITFNYDPLVSSAGLSGVPNSHWEVTEWEDGTTEGGSSGSPLFDQNHRIVGQLHGGEAACNNISYDAYGKFTYSWNTGTSAATRLQDWLDSANTGILVVDGKNCSEPLYSLDAGVSQITAPDAFLCNVQLIEPQVIIRNYGSTPITSFTIAYQIDGGLINSLEWTGYLEFLNPAYITLPETTLASGEHTLWVSVTQPNGTSDENLLNDGIFYTFVTTTGDNVNVNIVCDYWAEETSFEIADLQGNVLYSESGFSSFETYSFDLCLPAGCYTFSILDAYGDGMNPEGSYALTLPDGTVAAEGGGDFGTEQSYNFCIEGQALQASMVSSPQQVCPLPAVIQFFGGPATATSFIWQFEGGTPATSTEMNPVVTYEEPGSYDVTLTVSDGTNFDEITEPDFVVILPDLNVADTIITPAYSPTATDGAISISISGGTPPYTYLWSNGATGSGTVTGLAPGDYCVTVTAANGCNLSECFTIGSFPVGISPNNNTLYTITAYPNPVQSAAQLNIGVAQAGNYFLKTFDITGRQLEASAPVALTKGLNTLPLDTRKWPAGVYCTALCNSNGQWLCTARIAVLR